MTPKWSYGCYLRVGITRRGHVTCTESWISIKAGGRLVAGIWEWHCKFLIRARSGMHLGLLLWDDGARGWIWVSVGMTKGAQSLTSVPGFTSWGWENILLVFCPPSRHPNTEDYPRRWGSLQIQRQKHNDKKGDAKCSESDQIAPLPSVFDGTVSMELKYHQRPFRAPLIRESGKHKRHVHQGQSKSSSTKCKWHTLIFQPWL